MIPNTLFKTVYSFYIIKLNLVQNQVTPSLDNYGILGTIFIYPISWLLFLLSIAVNNSAGLAIIALTLLIRLALLPLAIKQRKTFLKINEWRADKKIIDEKYANMKDKNKRKEKAREINAISKKHDFRPYTAGCLPFIIQGIVLISLFQSIMRETQFYKQEFLWFTLSSSDPFLVLNILILLSVFFQAKVTSPNYVKFRYILSIFLGLLSFLLPAAILLYITVSNIIVTVQYLVLSKLYKKKEVIKLESKLEV